MNELSITVSLEGRSPPGGGAGGAGRVSPSVGGSRKSEVIAGSPIPDPGPGQKDGNKNQDRHVSGITHSVYDSSPQSSTPWAQQSPISKTDKHTTAVAVVGNIPALPSPDIIFSALGRRTGSQNSTPPPIGTHSEYKGSLAPVEVPPLAGGGAAGAGEVEAASGLSEREPIHNSSKSTANIVKVVLKSANTGGDSPTMRRNQRTTSAYNMAIVVSSNVPPSTVVASVTPPRKLSIKPEFDGTDSPLPNSPHESTHGFPADKNKVDMKADKRSRDLTSSVDYTAVVATDVPKLPIVTSFSQQKQQQQQQMHKTTSVGRKTPLPSQTATDQPSIAPAVKTCYVTVMVTDRGGAMTKKELESLFLTVLTVRPEQQQQQQQRDGVDGAGAEAAQSNNHPSAVEQNQDPLVNRGSGLGLALAKEIIVLHHGDVLARSSEGEGNTIGFRIPFEVVVAVGEDLNQSSVSMKPFIMSVNNGNEKQPLSDVSTIQGPGEGQSLTNTSLLLAPKHGMTSAQMSMPVPLRAPVPARPSRLPNDLVVVALDDDSDNSDNDVPNNTARSDVKGKGSTDVETVGRTKKKTTTNNNDNNNHSDTTNTNNNTNTLSNDPTSDNGMHHNNIAGGGGGGSNIYPPPTLHNPKPFHKGSKGAGVTTLVISNRADAAFSNQPSPNISPSPSLHGYDYTIAQETLYVFEEEGNEDHVGGGGRITNMTSMSSTPFPQFTPRAMGTPLVRINEIPSISHVPSSASSVLFSSSSPPNEKIQGIMVPSKISLNPSNASIAQSIAALERASPLDSQGSQSNRSTSIRRPTAPRYQPRLRTSE